VLQGFQRQHRAHLHVASLVPLHAGDRPPLLEQTAALAVNSETLAIKPLDLTVTAGDARESLGVGPKPEPLGLGKCARLLNSKLLLR